MTGDYLFGGATEITIDRVADEIADVAEVLALDQHWPPDGLALFGFEFAMRLVQSHPEYAAGLASQLGPPGLKAIEAMDDVIGRNPL